MYYLKNISSLKIESTNFSLNDEQFKQIKKLSENVESSLLILFWQFTIQVLSELEIISNQNLSIEMFLIRLVHLKDVKNVKNSQNLENIKAEKDIIQKPLKSSDNHLFKSKTIDQMRNIVQEDKDKKINEEDKNTIQIKSFDELIEVCNKKKEIQLKYELENNVNLVSFEKNRIEISFNDNLGKDFLKIISSKLFDWTGERWIITLSKKTGQLTKKETKTKNKNDSLEVAKQTTTYKKIKEMFSDAELIDVKKDDYND